MSKYSEETLKEAVRLVTEEGWSYREAVKVTGVPKTTIFAYSKASVVTKKKMGREKVLTDDEELCLVQWAVKLSQIGFPITDNDLLDQVQKLKRRKMK